MVVCWEQCRCVDEVVLRETLVARGEWEAVGGGAGIIALLDRSGTTAHVGEYAKRLRHFAQLRQLLSMARQVEAACAQPDADPEGVQALAMGVIGTIERPDTSSWYGVEAVDRAATPNRAPRYFRTTCGLRLARGGDGYNVIGARPGMGKSALLLNNISLPALERGERVVIYSGEMDVEIVIRRMVCALSGASIQEVNGWIDEGLRPVRIDPAAITDAINLLRELADGRLVVEDSSRLTGPHIRHSAEMHRQRMGALDLVVVDHLNLLDHQQRRGERIDLAMKRTSSGFREMQKDLAICLVVLAQLNRSVDDRHPPMPRMSDIRECGAAEEDAGLIAGIYRPAGVAGATDADPEEAWVPILKHRNGQTGMLRPRFDGRRMMFREEGA